EILRPGVEGLLAQLITDLNSFATGSIKLDDFGRILKDVVQLRDRLVKLLTNPVTGLRDLVNLQDRTDQFLKQFGIPTKVTLSFDWKPHLKTPSWPILLVDQNDAGPTEFLIRADAVV